MEQGFDWKSLAILTFTNGVLVEGGIKVTRTFINYIGVRTLSSISSSLRLSLPYRFTIPSSQWDPDLAPRLREGH